MANIVYAWELGGGFGHTHAFLALARRLREAGHEVVFILRDLLHAERELNSQGFRTLQAPLWQAKLLGLPDPTTSLSEILLHYGFFAEEHLSALVRAWLELYHWAKADLVVGDYAPTAMLAARIAGLTAATFGTGFCRPPALEPLPNLRDWIPIHPERLRQADRRVLDTSNQVLSHLRSPQIHTVTEIFAMHEDFLCTYAELDHYPERSDGHYWGSLYNLVQGESVAWPERREYRIFCYLKPGFPRLQEFLDGLGKLGKHEVIMFCPGLARHLVEKYSTAEIRIFTHPIKLGGLIKRCDLGICLAGHGTISAMLHAGIPLLLLPTNLEQYLTSRRIAQMGAGILIADHDGLLEYPEVIAHLLANPDYRQAADNFSRKYRLCTQDLIHHRIFVRILELLGSAPPCRKPYAAESSR